MARIYLNPSWVDACSDHEEWSGQGPNDRKRRSHMIGDSANIRAYADTDKDSKKPAKKERSLQQQLIPATGTIDKLDELELKLHKEFMSGELDDDEYEQLSNALQLKRKRAWKSLCKARGIPEEIEGEDDDDHLDLDDTNARYEGDFVSKSGAFLGHFSFVWSCYMGLPLLLRITVILAGFVMLTRI